MAYEINKAAGESVTQKHSIKDKKMHMFRTALRGEEGGEKGKRQRAGVGGNLFAAGEVTQHFKT